MAEIPKTVSVLGVDGAVKYTAPLSQRPVNRALGIMLCRI